MPNNSNSEDYNNNKTMVTMTIRKRRTTVPLQQHQPVKE
jgi:hypothetical protein